MPQPVICSNVLPVCGGEVVERQPLVAAFLQAVSRFGLGESSSRKLSVNKSFPKAGSDILDTGKSFGFMIASDMAVCSWEKKMLCNSNFSHARRPLQLSDIHNFRQYLRHRSA